MNTPVNFELAKLLKEKGFNEPCQFLRVGGKYRINYENEGDLFNNQCPSTQIPNDWFLAPTIAEVVMWLHEKHNIWISVIITYPKTFEYSIVKLDSTKELARIHQQVNSPTKAYEVAILYTLNSLI